MIGAKTMSNTYIATANRLLKANTNAQLSEVDADIKSLYMAGELSYSEFSKLEDLADDRATWNEEISVATIDQLTEHLNNLQG